MALSYCVKERKQTESTDPQIKQLPNGRRMELSICASCGNRKARFLKKEA